MHRSRSLVFALLALAALVLPGCPAFTSVMKGIGLQSRPALVLTEAVPQDFELVMHVMDQQNPPTDYLVTYRRSGRCDYRVTVRSPKRRVNDGSFDILDGQVNSLWATVRAVNYDTLEERYPAEGEGRDRDLGVQKFSVRGDDISKEVQAHFTKVPAIEKLRALALSLMPEKALSDTGKGDVTTSVATQQVIGDMQTKTFYPADDARLKDVPTDRRQPFPTWFDAVNYGYAPAQGVKLGERR
ncbi:MAG: hypothetical protein K8T90_06125 [Planctomycetes bacterium]|nr:hypothetical protein [Planctomycetota bacterium]